MSPEEFARAAADFLLAQGEQRPVAINLPHNRLVVGELPGPVSFISLIHAHREYEAANAAERERVLSRRFWASIQRAPELRADSVKRSVLPRLRDRAWFSAVRRQAELDLGADEEAIDEVMLPHVPLNDELAVHLAFELATSVSEIGADRFPAWGLRFEDLLEHAKKNLLARSKEPFEEPTKGVFVSPYHDTFDATRMVLPDLFRALPVKGLPVVIAPTHDIVFVSGDADEAGLMQIATWGEEALLEPRAHSAIAFRLEEAGWRPWMPPKGHSAWAKFKLLNLQTTASSYARQKEVLEALLQANGHDITVGTMRAFRTPEGEIFTASAWLENVEALLPMTDRIDFVKVSKDGSANGQVWSTSFDIARRTLGELMQPIGDLPERYRVKGFPTFEQLEKMAAEAQAK